MGTERRHAEGGLTLYHATIAAECEKSCITQLTSKLVDVFIFWERAMGDPLVKHASKRNVWGALLINHEQRVCTPACVLIRDLPYPQVYIAIPEMEHMGK